LIYKAFQLTALQLPDPQTCLALALLTGFRLFRLSSFRQRAKEKRLKRLRERKKELTF